MHILDPIPNIFIEVGPIVWYKYSLMILIGIIIATLLGIKEGNKLGIKTDDIIDGLLIIVPISIIGTRLWYVAFEWEHYAWDIVKIFSISDGGLAIHGGFITAFISAYFFTKYKKINLFRAFDIMVPGFLIAQASGRWGNFFNQEAHGGMIGGVDVNGDPLLTLDQQRSFLSDTLHLPDFITNNMLIDEPGITEGYHVLDIDGVTHTAAYYHPTFLYESMWNILGFLIVLLLRRTKWLRSGELLAFYLVWYGVGRFFIEGMRTDSLYIGNTGLRTAQIISIVMILGAVVYVYLTRKVFKNQPYHEVLTENVGKDINGKGKVNPPVKFLFDKELEQITNDELEKDV
jgi:phosphatidylglycerol:prolipoprotein diacylglycerol transferase